MTKFPTRKCGSPRNGKKDGGHGNIGLDRPSASLQSIEILIGIGQCFHQHAIKARDSPYNPILEPNHSCPWARNLAPIITLHERLRSVSLSSSSIPLDASPYVVGILKSKQLRLALRLGQEEKVCRWRLEYSCGMLARCVGKSRPAISGVLKEKALMEIATRQATPHTQLYFHQTFLFSPLGVCLLAIRASCLKLLLWHMSSAIGVGSKVGLWGVWFIFSTWFLSRIYLWNETLKGV